MSWHFSLALVEAFWEDSSLVRKSYARLKTTRTASKSSFDDKKTGRSRLSQSGTMPKPSTDTHSVGSRMWSLLDFPANPSQSPDNNREKMTTGTSGLTPVASLEKCDQEQFYWRMYPVLWDIYLPYSETWPLWAMTQNRLLYRLPKPGHLTGGIDGGVWPTPTANTRPNEGNVRLLRKQVLHGELAEEEAAAMLNGKSPFESQGKVKQWPTPTLEDATQRISGAKGRLNPDWVEYLMGWPRGWTSPEPMAEGEMDRWLSAAKEGTLWDDDPAENGQITRLTTKRKHRPDRLKALGNGQVPTQLVLAWKTLSKKD